jgi:hypothetical protein
MADQTLGDVILADEPHQRLEMLAAQLFTRWATARGHRCGSELSVFCRQLVCVRQ